MNASYLGQKFAAALPYDRYVRTGKEDQQKRWHQVYAAAQPRSPALIRRCSIRS